jgi:activating signal cointegrator complex subunit 2
VLSGSKQSMGLGRVHVVLRRIYNYAKEGAQLVHSRAEADAALEAARQAAMAIHGLGPGGNKAHLQPRPAQRQGQGDEGEDGEEDGEGGQGGGGGRGGGRGGGGGGRGPPNYARKEQNKAAVANHHRKDRALRKQGML